MTRDDMIRMAREAGMERTIAVHKDGTRTVELPHPDLLANFAAFVATAEREACARVCEVAEDDEFYTGKQYAAAIRARGQA
jgi:hypothetical protein